MDNKHVFGYIGIILAVLVIGVAFWIQTKSLEAELSKSNENVSDLEYKLDEVEEAISPPNVDILSGPLSLPISGSDYEISVSKLIIEELGLNTFIRVEIENKDGIDKSYTVYNKIPTRTQEGYIKINNDSSYIVVPLTGYFVIPAKTKQTITILVGKVGTSCVDTEAWVTVQEITDKSMQSELVLRLLIKGTS